MKRNDYTRMQGMQDEVTWYSEGMEENYFDYDDQEYEVEEYEWNNVVVKNNVNLKKWVVDATTVVKLL